MSLFGGDHNVKHLRQVEPLPPELPTPEPNPLQTALENYQQMTYDLADARQYAHDTRIENHSLRAEITMLREMIDRADSDRIRLQAISSTLLGRLLSIQSTIEDAVRDSIHNGIQAEQEATPEPAPEPTGITEPPINQL
jgi:hypothetical protein